MRIFAVLAAAILSGCAVTAEDVATYSDWEVCRFTMGGPRAQLATNEMRRRNLDCRPYYPAITARMQADNAATANAMQLLAPAPQPMRQPQSCRTYRLGTTWQTDCN